LQDLGVDGDYIKIAFKDMRCESVEWSPLTWDMDHRWDYNVYDDKHLRSIKGGGIS
jgi:hypothetical protein